MNLKKAEEREMLSRYNILTDNREQEPFLYPNTVRGTLDFGDYTIEWDGVSQIGMVCCERKGSVSELYQATGSERERFERQLERMKNCSLKFVLCEFDYMSIVTNAPPGILEPQCVYGSIIKWHSVYNVPFIFCKNRTNAKNYLWKFFWEFVKYRLYKQGGD